MDETTLMIKEAAATTTEKLTWWGYCKMRDTKELLGTFKIAIQSLVQSGL